MSIFSIEALLSHFTTLSRFSNWLEKEATWIDENVTHILTLSSVWVAFSSVVGPSEVFVVVSSNGWMVVIVDESIGHVRVNDSVVEEVVVGTEVVDGDGDEWGDGVEYNLEYLKKN